VWLTAAAVVAIGVLAAAVGSRIHASRAEDAAKNRPAPPLEFATRDITRLTPQRLTAQLALPGTVQAVSQATVRSKLSAEVRRVLVREGDRVTAGQVIAEFDSAQLRVQLIERTAALESANAQLAQAQRTRQANTQLVQRNFISQNAFDTAAAAYRAQAAAVEAAQAQLEQTRLLLADAIVRAPISGQIAKRYVQPGEKLAFDAPLVSIVDLAHLEVAAQAAVSDVPQITQGMPAEVEVEGLTGRAFVGRVDRINPSTEPGTRTIHVYVTLSNEGSVLRAGMFARVRLAIDSERAVPALPITAIRTEAGHAYVWTIAADKIARRAVTLGRRDERAQWVEVVDGVGADEQVLATKFDNLKEGLTARIVAGAMNAADSGPQAETATALR
ncbi:MAG TPA: efflux RND transporter periplasmic adaptor subunit, partial [Burkholderiaceae bacterium]|nr:efflux RND transporter periplasmic adaptor subunit [Burkholderiaceae bacterium]